MVCNTLPSAQHSSPSLHRCALITTQYCPHHRTALTTALPSRLHCTALSKALPPPLHHCPQHSTALNTALLSPLYCHLPFMGSCCWQCPVGSIKDMKEAADLKGPNIRVYLGDLFRPLCCPDAVLQKAKVPSIPMLSVNIIGAYMSTSSLR